MRTEGKKIGLLGGTFDPIHFGHLNLAFELMEKRGLDQVWFIPTQLNPLKIQSPPTSIDHRLAMTRLAIRKIPQFHLKDIEKKRSSPSYTIDTLRIFIAKEASNPIPNQFYLLLGEDAIPKFLRWHLPEEIVKLVPLLIGSRSSLEKNVLEGCNLFVQAAIQKGLTTIHLMDISGTEIRKRLAQSFYCSHLVPAPVLRYIQKNQLYHKL